MRIDLDAFYRIPGQSKVMDEVIDRPECNVSIIADPGGSDENDKE
jgi:hypothetical protein